MSGVAVFFRVVEGYGLVGEVDALPRETPYFSSISQILLKSRFSGSVKESKSIRITSDETCFSFSDKSSTLLFKRHDFKVQTLPSEPSPPAFSNDEEA